MSFNESHGTPQLSPAIASVRITRAEEIYDTIRESASEMFATLAATKFG
jgi:hypothetical protein